MTDDKSARPMYPDKVWADTAAGQFAALCRVGNNVPLKMYIEAFRCILGAVMGDRLSAPTIDGAVPRSYVILLAPAGMGKSTSIKQARKFFDSPWRGDVSDTDGLLFYEQCVWRSTGIGAYSAMASSAPGMMKLLAEDKKMKGTSPNLCWLDTTPRVISIYDELKNFLSSLLISGGTGKAFDGVVCSLFDGIDFAAPATDKRLPIHGQMMFSLLGAVTEADWFDLLGQSDAVGGGLMSRLTLIGTLGEYELVGKLDVPDFTELRSSFLPRLRLLADAPCRMGVTEAASRTINDWLHSLPEGTVRMNIQA